MIYILSGNIRTGKTTTLMEWSKNREDVDGILCPDDEFGRRYFLKIKGREKIPLEVLTNHENVISIGNFNFLMSSFKTANAYLKAIGDRQNSKYTIIDELGKLELQNEGLHDSTKELIRLFESDENHQLLLVVRSYLVEEIIDKYQIETYKLIDSSELENLV